MFEDSLVESSGRFRTNRGKTTTLAFVIQFSILGILILIPLIYTEALPTKQLMTMLVAPPPPPPPPPPPAEVHVIKHISEIVQGQLRTPTKIPNKIVKIVEDEAPAPNPGGVTGGIAGGAPGGVLGSILSSANSTPPKVVVQKTRVSGGVMQGNLLNDIKPQYPQMARTARIQGDVVLAATISKSGAIENLRVLSGHPMLNQAALDAVRQWRYKPYMLSGEPTEVETTITVKFTLGG